MMAVLYHETLFQDDEERHQYCPANGWCSFKKNGKLENKSHHIHPVVYKHIRPTWESYTQENVLRRIVPGFNTNSLECLNNVLWNNIGKTKWHGFKRVYIASCTAIIQFEKDSCGREDVMRELGLEVSTYTTTAFMKSSQTRSYHKIRKTAKETERFRKSLDSMKAR